MNNFYMQLANRDFEYKKGTKMRKQSLINISCILALIVFSWTSPASARDVEVNANSGEINVYVNPGEPTQLQFPGEIGGGFKKKASSVTLDRKGSDLIIFPKDNITTVGEALIVRLGDGRSYSIRVKKADDKNARDGFVTILDDRGSIVLSEDEEQPPFKERKDEYAPPTVISGFMRELMLAAEFGKAGVPGYRKNEKYKGQVVLNDGTLVATIDSIYMGPGMWGYVIDASNMLEQTQKINPASFRLDGTRAISASRWELAPKPISIEQQISGADKAKIYIITRAKDK